MSKLTLRTETNCLNCGFEVTQRFCGSCGQENTLPHHTLAELGGEAAKEIVDIDGSFYRTLKNIFLRPGLVPKEFSSGKRKSYSNPVRMFFVIGALFVILLGEFINVDYLVDFITRQYVSAASLEGKVVDAAAYRVTIYPVYAFILDKVSYAIILTLPLLCLVLKFTTGRKRYYFTDLFVYKVCNYVAYLVIWTVPLGILFLLGIRTTNAILAVVAVNTLLFYLYTFLSTKYYFGYSAVKAFFFAWMQIILWTVVFAILMALVIFFYYLFAGML